MKNYTKDELKKIIACKDKQIAELQNKLDEMQAEASNLKNDLCYSENEANYLKTELKAERIKAEKAMDSYMTIENAFFWKMTKPARIVLDVVKEPGRSVYYAGLVKQALSDVKENGLPFPQGKVKTKNEDVPTYGEWMKAHQVTEEELERQRKTQFDKRIRFSITVPLYNTPEAFLREMIDSVQNQTYSGWELCLVDGSDSDHGYVERICKEYKVLDTRMKYRKLTENLGISGNTNACLEMAEGDYIALFDHDDILHPSALYEMMCVICEKDADIIYTDEATFISPDINDITVINFKPDFAPDNLRANNYICHFTAFKKSLMDQVGMFRSEYDGSQDHDLILRLTEKAENIVHIPKVLYYWRAHEGSVALVNETKNYAADNGKKAVQDSIERMGFSAKVDSSRALNTMYRIRYKLVGAPKVSIIIPNYDHIEDLQKCINSIEEKSTYENYEIIIVENNSKKAETFEYYKEIEKEYSNIKTVNWPKEFNYSAINNYGIREAAAGEYILLLNNDIEVITPNWMEEMLMYCQRSDVGAVGAMLYYPDETVQHAGVILGKGGIAGHAFYGVPRGEIGYMGRMCYAQDVAAVTAACMMIRRDVWDDVGGLDEGYKVAFNDVDLCMKIRKAGYLIVWTPYAELYHYESKSRGRDDDTPEKIARFNSEIDRFRSKWSDELDSGDPYYNPNFRLDPRYRDFTVK